MCTNIALVSSVYDGECDIEDPRFLSDAETKDMCEMAEKYLIKQLVKEQGTFILQIFPKNKEVGDVEALQKTYRKCYDWSNIKELKELLLKATQHDLKNQALAIEHRINVLEEKMKVKKVYNDHLEALNKEKLALNNKINQLVNQWNIQIDQQAV